MDSFDPSDNSTLTDDQSEVLDFIFGEKSESDSYSNSDSCNKSNDKKKKKKPFYDCSYMTIIFVIIITLIFILLANPATNMWFASYVPDPYFRLITIALIFALFVFIVDILLSYYGPEDEKRKH